MMSKTVWKSCLLLLAALSMPILVPSSANAGEDLESASTVENSLANNELSPYSYEDRENFLAQVTSISQFRDVSPRAWSFEALQSLVENYGCIAGYPDGSYRGDRALTRYEFAAGMNACLEAVERRVLATKTTAPESTPPETARFPESVAEVIDRAFFHNMDSFYGSTDLLDQINTQLGIIPFVVPAAFPENQITRDAELVHAISQDALRQQSSQPPVRTRDLPNPFNTSLRENPGYIRPARLDSSREVIIESR
jgi:hypothetical protein